MSLARALNGSMLWESKLQFSNVILVLESQWLGWKIIFQLFGFLHLWSSAQNMSQMTILVIHNIEDMKSKHHITRKRKCGTQKILVKGNVAYETVHNVWSNVHTLGTVVCRKLQTWKLSFRISKPKLRIFCHFRKWTAPNSTPLQTNFWTLPAVIGNCMQILTCSVLYIIFYR